MIKIKVLTSAIVSNSDIIKNYKICREKAEGLGKIFILKNNQPDAVLFSIKEYERLSPIIEYIESLDEKELAKFVETLPSESNRRNYTIEHLRNDMK